MKILIIFLLALPLFLFSQNPLQNSGFEEWADGEASNWYSNNIPSMVTTVSQSANANSGSSAARVEIAEFAGNPYNGSISAGGATNPYIPVTQNFNTLSGFYQLQTTGADYILVIANLLDANNSLVASISKDISPVTNQYTPFSIDFNYAVGNGNDTAYLTLQFLFSNRSADSIQVGAFFLIDDIELSGATRLEPIDDPVPGKINLSQNYPNPFNPVTNIEFGIPESGPVSLNVFNMLGEKVAEIVNDQLSAGKYSVQWNAGFLPSGTYIYKLETPKGIENKRLLLIK